MRKPWKRKRRSLFYTVMTDVLFNLLAFYMLMVGVKTNDLTTSQAIASRVPGLEKNVSGLTGKLVKAKKDLTQAQHQGERLSSIVKGQTTKIGHLNKQNELFSSVNGGLKRQLGLATTELGGANLKIGRLIKKITEYENQFRAGAPVTLVVVIDVTGSMQPAIDELLSALSALCEDLPTSSKEFSVGVIAFRKGVVAEFPITRILPHYVDDSRSQKAVLNFVDSLHSEKSWTEHASVFSQAAKMFRETAIKPNPQRLEQLIFISDVGTSELDGEPNYSTSERKQKALILSRMQKWAAVGNRGIASLYVESDYTRKDPSAQESRQWFEALGKVSPRSGFYTDTSDLLRAMLKATRK